jgi:hypothetical protein
MSKLLLFAYKSEPQIEIRSVWLSLSEKNRMPVVARRIDRSTNEITAVCESVGGECRASAVACSVSLHLDAHQIHLSC